MEKHFVTFYSPGTIVAETTTKPINSWDIEEAIKLSKNINERHGARPYGFMFSTRARSDDELDSKIIKKSCMYYLGGKILTVQDLEKENDPQNKIIISNMKFNNFKRIVRHNNSWIWCQPLEENDVVLE